MASKQEIPHKKFKPDDYDLSAEEENALLNMEVDCETSKEKVD